SNVPGGSPAQTTSASLSLLTISPRCSASTARIALRRSPLTGQDTPSATTSTGPSNRTRIPGPSAESQPSCAKGVPARSRHPRQRPTPCGQRLRAGVGEEAADDVGAGLWLVGQDAVAAALEDAQVGAGDGGGDLAGELRRADPVVAAADDQGGRGDL